jgi:hypothetical protein
MGIELKLQLWRHIDDATQRQRREENSAALSIDDARIVLACKRNAVVRNIAFGSGDSADG